MRVMVLVKATKDSEAGTMPETKLITEMMAFNTELVNAGIILAGEGLHPSRRGVRVTSEQGKKRVIDGPFAETKEIVAGFWLWQVKSLEEAVEWVKRMPQQEGAEQEVEIRPVLEADDFGENLTPELRAEEERLRERSASKNG